MQAGSIWPEGKTDYQVVCDASVGDMDPLICHHQKPIATDTPTTHTQTILVSVYHVHCSSNKQ